MKALKYILFTIGGIALLILLMGLFARHNYRVERSIEIDSPRSVVFDQVRLFKNLPNWSPWQQMDPNMKTSITGTDGEVGAMYTWDGNKKVGKGSMTITSIKADRVDMNVDFSGFGASPAYFWLEAEGDETTRVTWVLDMRVPFPFNAFAMLTDVNAFVGKDFATGLANLEKYCEALTPKKYRGFSITESEQAETIYASIRQTIDFAGIPAYLGEQFDALLPAIEKGGAKVNGAPTGFYWTWDTVAMKTDMSAAFPLDKTFKAAEPVQLVTLKGKALTIDFMGDMSKIGEAHMAMDDYILEKKLKQVPPVLEVYVTDPATEPDTAKWLTKVVYFVEPEGRK